MFFIWKDRRFWKTVKVVPFEDGVPAAEDSQRCDSASPGMLPNLDRVEKDRQERLVVHRSVTVCTYQMKLQSESV